MLQMDAIARCNARCRTALTLVLALSFSMLLHAGDAQLGEALYKRGSTVEEATATIAGGIRAEVKNFPCQACHRSGGRGGFEGGVAIPPINWRSLTVRRPSDHASAYDEQSIERALVAGLDSEANSLHKLMPRFTFSDADLQNLMSYLKSLDHPVTSGVSDHSLRIGVVQSASDEYQAGAAIVKQVLQSFFAELNANGGIHGRTVELAFTPPDAIRHDVLCYIGGILGPSDLAVAEQARDSGSPILFPISQLAPDSMHSVAFLADFSDQLFSLLTHLQTTMTEGEKVTLIVDADQQGKILRARLEDSMPASNNITVVELNSDDTPEQQTYDSDRILWFSRRHNFSKFLSAMQRRQAPVTIYTSVDLAGAAMLNHVALPANSQLILSNPRGMPTTASAGYLEFQRFRRDNELPDEHSEWQRTAYLAANLLVHSLKRAGRRIDREGFVKVATTIRNLPTGVMPPVSTSATQPKPSQILQFDPETTTLLSLTEWL